MPPRLHLFSSPAAQQLSCLARPSRHAVKLAWYSSSQPRRGNDDKISEQAKGPNQDVLPHVSEEQAAIDKIMGEEPPDLGQGTPVEDILKNDPEAKSKAPKVMREKIDKASSPGGSRSFSTSSRRYNDTLLATSSTPSDLIPMTFRDITYVDGGEGHKFPMPPRPGPNDKLQKRYDPVIQQLTRTIMRSGKLGAAQKTVEDILDVLRTSPAPQRKSAKPGVGIPPTAGPLNQLPLYPLKYLVAVLDALGPLIKIRQLKGMAGGGKTTPIPIPIPERLRRRYAIQWILDNSDKRIEVKLADRMAKEIIAVAEGTSSAWDRRAQTHKMAVTARVNVKLLVNPPRKMGTRF